MNIKLRLTILSFLQFFVWGAWLTTLGSYGFGFKAWTGKEFGIVFSTMGVAAIFMPTLMGIVADKWINVERLYGILHILYAVTLLFLPLIDDPTIFFWALLIGMCFYMPTLALSNSLSYTLLKKDNIDVVKVFPTIRVWGTVGFIFAMWITNLFSDPQSPWSFGLNLGNELATLTGQAINTNQFYIAAVMAIFLGLFAFSLPKNPPLKSTDDKRSFAQLLGLDAFKLFKNYRFALFLIFSLFLGAALQLTNMYGDTYIKDFENLPEYAHSPVVKYSTMIVSISQISETLFILTIPFFLKRYGIKIVILMSMIAWVLRFGLFSFGDPNTGLWMIILSNIVYGMAFDFFNVSGSLFVENSTEARIRSSAQGLFMMMTNGFGAIVGSYGSGIIIDQFFTNADGLKDWHQIWLCFAIYAAIVTVFFAILFKYKHNPEVISRAVDNTAH